MTIVAITRWARPPAQECAALAELFGVEIADLRLVLAGPVPVVCTRTTDERASELVDTLRSRGHGAVACVVAELQIHADIHAPRTYAFEGTEFVADRPVGEAMRIAYDDIVAIVRVRLKESSETTTTKTGKKFSLGRAIATGGLMTKKKQTTTTRNRTGEREQLLYIVSAAGREWMCMREHRLRHQGLGARLKRTAMENFATMVEMMREAAGQAFYDDRLMTQRRRTSSVLTSENVLESSNQFECYLAANLIVRAHLEHQL